MDTIPSEKRPYRPLLPLPDAYDALKAAITALTQSILVTDAALPAFVDELPTPISDDLRGNVPPPTLIVPTSFYGTEARVKAAEMIAALITLKEQNPKMARRLPGAIAASARTIELIEALNLAKDDFKITVQALDGTRAARRITLRKVCSGINLMQTYRKIAFTRTKVDGASFTWSRMSSRSRRVSVGFAIKEVTEQRDNPSFEPADEKSWHETCEMAVDLLSKLPTDEMVVIKTAVPPHPRVNISAKGQKTYMENASLPFFYQFHEQEPQISPLLQLDTTEKGRTRAARHLMREPYISAFHIYRIAP